MTRRRPMIDLSEEDAETLRRAGFGQMIVWRWRNKKSGPSRTFLPRINAALGRDVRQPAPVAAPQTVKQPAANCQTNVKHCQIDISSPVAVAIYGTTLNACADDDLCLAARTAMMRYEANLLLDQKRDTPCVSCKRGIARAKAEAAKKVALVGALICSCGEEKTRDARTCHACASERRKSYRAQPLRGMKRATA